MPNQLEHAAIAKAQAEGTGARYPFAAVPSLNVMPSIVKWFCYRLRNCCWVMKGMQETCDTRSC